ncbi:MAG: hypothetical protein KF862_20960 [Chitinophagaceae bacterium]|nr:hypothetical protein [Chitinophagaceae bacterium]
MNRSIVKPVLAGVVIGLGLFFIPFFILRVALFLLIAGLVFRLFAGRRRRFGGPFKERRFAFADHIRNMSEEEYTQFKQQPPFGCGRAKNFTNPQNDQHEK